MIKSNIINFQNNLYSIYFDGVNFGDATEEQIEIIKKIRISEGEEEEVFENLMDTTSITNKKSRILADDFYDWMKINHKNLYDLYNCDKISKNRDCIQSYLEQKEDFQDFDNETNLIEVAEFIIENNLQNRIDEMYELYVLINSYSRHYESNN